MAFWALFLLIGGVGFILANALHKIVLQQQAIAKALFARIPMRDPTEDEIMREAKGEVDWLNGDAGRYYTPTASINNTQIRQRVRDRLYDRQRAPKFS